MRWTPKSWSLATCCRKAKPPGIHQKEKVMKDLDLSNVPLIDISGWADGDDASHLALAREVD